MTHSRNIFTLVICLLLFIGCHDDNDRKGSLDARRGLFNSTWPAPIADLWRSSSVVDAGLPANINENSLVSNSVTLPPYPMFGITYDDNTVFVLGGSPFLLDLFTDEYRGIRIEKTLPEIVEEAIDDLTVDPYVAKVNTDTMEAEILTLPRRLNIVNYIGSIMAHKNGLIYVLASARLFEIDPHTLEIKRSLDLPLPEEEAEFVAYNGLGVWPETGDLILKRADFSGRTDEILLLVDIGDEELHVKATTVFNIGTARFAVDAGPPALLYVPGPTQTLRFFITETGFDYDEQWSETYRSVGDGTQQSPAPVFMGKFDSVTFVNNGSVGLGVTAPMIVCSQSTTTTAPTLFCYLLDKDEPGAVFSVNSADPYKTGITAALDSINGITTAWQLTENGTLMRVWTSNKYKTSSGTAIAVSQGHLYTDDRTCDMNGENCTIYFVVLDLESGGEIARTEVEGTLPTIGHIFVGKNDAFYIATEAGTKRGFLTRITAQ